MRPLLILSGTLIAAGLWFAPNPALASPELVKSKNCSACHFTDRRSIGPSFKEIAAKYSADPKAVEYLAGKIQKGGSGVWGTTMMPASPQVNQAEAETLARWILTQK